MSAQEKFGAVPNVEVTILVDSLAGMLAQSTKTIRRHSGEPLIAEPGFGVLIDLPSMNLRILWDAGASSTALLGNLRTLEIDPTSIDMIALSHGHWDHVTGLSEILRSIQTLPERKTFPAGTTDEELLGYAQPAKIPLIVHPAAFRERWAFLRDGRRHGPVNPTSRAEWEALGADVVESEGPYRLADGCWTTGYIPRESFESEGRSPDTMRFRVGSDFLPDDTDEDQAIVLHLEGKGLVIISGCAHSGIVNTVEHARKMTGVETIHAILGGFHLGRSKEEEVARTVAAIAKMQPDMIVPTHCTGFDAMRRFANEMPDAFVLGTVGTKFSI
ncbi:MBL fold metallo-hydrolase [Candidatus Bipolaricaulota bacterium]